MVFYRQYRSQKIEDLDSESVRTTLQAVFSDPSGKKEIPHAFLFTGPKGLGKTSAARIIAKTVNCTGKKDAEPCNKCEQCISITGGTNMDVLEIDAASNRGIDEIRDLREKIRLSPVKALKKAYIIDEVHMLTNEAFNALLKTLEEPPSHALFILCTTEPQKIPSTILSRCFHVAFHLATDKELVRSFKRIVKGEKIDVEDEALSMIARLSEGGFRDGVKILEEMVVRANGKKITKEFIEENYKVQTSFSYAKNLLESMRKGDTKSALLVVQAVISLGIEAKYFLGEIMGILHESMLSKAGVPGKEVVVDLDMEESKVLFALFSNAYKEMRFAAIPQLPLEMAIIEWGGMVKNPSAAETQVREKTLPVDDGVVSIASLRKKVGVMQKNKALYGEVEVKEEKPVVVVNTVELKDAPGNGEITKEWQDMFWKNIISEMKGHNHTVAGVMRSCTIRSYDKKNLVIEAGYKFHKERLDDMKTREALHKVCKMLTGNDLEIKIELRK